MAEREQIKKPAQKRDDAEEIEEAPATSERGEKIKAELDDLLDEIDDVLETNAEDFVKSLRAEGWPISDKQLPVTGSDHACRMEPSKTCWVCGERKPLDRVLQGARVRRRSAWRLPHVLSSGSQGAQRGQPRAQGDRPRSHGEVDRRQPRAVLGRTRTRTARPTTSSDRFGSGI